MRFPQGAPVFAVEVRSECDYGRAAEEKMAEQAKRYLKSPKYSKTVRAAIKEMYRQVSDLRLDERWLVSR